MRKKIISLLMAVVTAGSILTGSGCTSRETAAEAESTETQELLTNAQWITGLGGTFGMTDFTSEEPYFEDVTTTEEIYPYVQSCAEWGIFEETGGEFKPEENTTREFAVQTAVMAAEVLNDVTDDTVYDECIPYALNNGILDSDKESYLQENITYAQGQEILDWALSEYQNRDFEEYQDVELNEDLIDLSGNAAISGGAGGSTLIPAGTAEELKEGDIFLAPGTPEAPEGIAKKVTSVTVDDEGNQIVETTEPSLEELYSKMDFAVRVEPEKDDVIVYEGVTLASVEENHNVYATSAVQTGKLPVLKTPYKQKNNIPVNLGSSFQFQVNLKNGTPSVSAEWQTSYKTFQRDLVEAPDGGAAAKLFEKSNTLYQNDGNGSRSIEKITNKFQGGYEINGSIVIDQISVDLEARPKKTLGVPTGIEFFYVSTNCNITSTLTAKGEVKDELKIATLPITTPVPGLTVKIDLVLFANANGELEIKVVTTSTTSFEYRNGNFKETTSTNMDSADFEGALSIEFGPQLKVVPCVLGVEITDADIRLAMRLDFSSGLTSEDRTEEAQNEIRTIRSWIWNVEGTATAPIVSLGIGNSKKCLLKLNKNWTLTNGWTWNLFEPKQYNIGEDIINTEKKDDNETEEEDAQDIEGTEDTGSSKGNPEDEADGVKNPEDANRNDSILGDVESLSIDNYALAVAVGQSKMLTVTHTPEGYAPSDIRWESDNTSVVTVKAGNVTAVSPGTAMIKVSTSDGKYQIFCSVIVTSDEEVEFEAL